MAKTTKVQKLTNSPWKRPIYQLFRRDFPAHLARISFPFQYHRSRHGLVGSDLGGNSEDDDDRLPLLWSHPRFEARSVPQHAHLPPLASFLSPHLLGPASLVVPPNVPSGLAGVKAKNPARHPQYYCWAQRARLRRECGRIRQCLWLWERWLHKWLPMWHLRLRNGGCWQCCGARRCRRDGSRLLLFRGLESRSSRSRGCRVVGLPRFAWVGLGPFWAVILSRLCYHSGPDSTGDPDDEVDLISEEES